MMNFVWNTIECTGELKLMIKFCLCLLKFSELEIYFLSVPRELLSVLFQANIYVVMFKKVQKTKIYW